ncbi:hypothetical protein ABZX12_06580 [Kribbella sp. NPDC003505]|uniref:hypothetical protein n=1 Tax=Kribbella sp. NPDC003505 TaxID=3154448 RepID=UPI0033B3EBE4
MNLHYTVIAIPLFVCGTAVAGAAQASAVPPREPDAQQSQPRVEVPVDDTANEVAQTTAGVLAGAGLATTATWFYRRRRPLAAH